MSDPEEEPGPGPVAALVERFREADVADKVCALIGVERGRSFACVLPGHQSGPKSASVVQDKGGKWVYYCRDGVSPQRVGEGDARIPKAVFFLPEVYAYTKAGVEWVLEGQERPTWTARTLIDAKVIEPGTVRLAELPKEVVPATRKVWKGFEALMQARWHFAPDQPAAYSQRFVARWCGVSQAQAHRSVRELIQTGCLVTVETRGRTPFFEVGEGFLE